MKKLFVCLANSKKYFQRCIAGIELTPSPVRGAKYQVVKRAEHPVWLRPVSDSEHGEVPVELVEHIKLLDLVEVDVRGAVPWHFQTENVLFVPQRLSVVDQINKLARSVDKLLSLKPPPLFGTMQKWVHTSEIGHLDHSLVLIKPEYPILSATPTLKGTPQLRAGFIYNNVPYNLPVTDIEAEAQFNKDPTFLEPYTNIYFTISLAREFNAQHYKLVAGIVYF